MDAVQVVGHLVVGLDDGMGPVPRPPIEVVGQHRGQRAVGPLPAGHRLCLDDSRAHQWVAEANTQPVEPQETGGHRVLEVGGPDVIARQVGGGSQDLGKLVAVVDGCHQQGVAGGRREVGEARREGSLQASS